MNLTDVMRTAGSTRRHRPGPVPDETLYRVLDNARFAPSGGNRQPWRVVVVRDAAVRAALSEIYRNSWYEFHAPLFTAPGEQPQPDYYADRIRAEGLGTALTTVLVPAEDDVRQLLRIPREYRVAAHLGIGWPQRPLPTRLSRRRVEDFTTADYFDGTAFSG